VGGKPVESLLSLALVAVVLLVVHVWPAVEVPLLVGACTLLAILSLLRLATGSGDRIAAILWTVAALLLFSMVVLPMRWPHVEKVTWLVALVGLAMVASIQVWRRKG
jgi:hypothetical protein